MPIAVCRFCPTISGGDTRIQGNRGKSWPKSAADLNRAAVGGGGVRVLFGVLLGVLLGIFLGIFFLMGVKRVVGVSPLEKEN
jgi:hypothetical protein